MSSSTPFINAIVVDQSSADRLSIHPFPLTLPAPGEVTIRVTAISLNRGETRRALTSTPTGTRPGWDFAGYLVDTNHVAQAPAVGTRVVGLIPLGAWAEVVHVPLHSLAVIPAGVTDAQAASLPMAGLTALHALRKGGMLLGRKVLVNGATGGVGQLAIQLAAAAGARVYAHIRQESQRPLVEAASTGGVIVGPTLAAAREAGPFDLIIDSVGGSALAAAVTMLKRRGTCVSFGASEGEPAIFDSWAFFQAPGASVQNLIIFDDLAATEPAAEGLGILLHLMEQGKLRSHIGLEAPWTEVATVAQQLLQRGFTGKAVLHLPAKSPSEVAFGQ